MRAWLPVLHLLLPGYGCPGGVSYGVVCRLTVLFLKPSERDPSFNAVIAKALEEAGLTKGVMNVVM